MRTLTVIWWAEAVAELERRMSDELEMSSRRGMRRRMTFIELN
jgi:hypothetical protein